MAVNDNTADIVMYGLLLLLPLSALAARRLPMKNTAKMVLAWVAIFGFAFILVAAWQSVTGVGAALGGIFR